MPISDPDLYRAAVIEDREHAEIYGRNHARGDFARHPDLRTQAEQHRRDRWRRNTWPRVTEAPDRRAAWYERQIRATLRRIDRAERVIARWEARTDTTPDDMAVVNVPIAARMRGMDTALELNRAAERAHRDLHSARHRLAWLTERKPT